jgi:hypothetical protein
MPLTLSENKTVDNPIALGEACFKLRADGWEVDAIARLINASTPDVVQTLIKNFVAYAHTAQIEYNLKMQAEEAAKERERQEIERIKRETKNAYEKELTALQKKYPQHWEDTRDYIKHDEDW